MNTKQWMTGGLIGTALTLSSTLAWGSLVAQQSTSDPTKLIVSGSPLTPTTNIAITAQGLADGTKAASYTQDTSSLAYNNSGLLNPNVGMINLWLYTGPKWAGSAVLTAPSFLIAEGANHWVGNSFTLFRETNGMIKFIRKNADGSDANETSYAIPGNWQANEWHNIGIAWEVGNTQQVYLDGALKVSADSTITQTAASTLFLGSDAFSLPWSAGGMIYDFTLYTDMNNVGDVMAAAAANTPSPIPEPAALGLLALAAGLTAARRRR